MSTSGVATLVRSRPVSVGELQRAWRAVQAGDFRDCCRPGPVAAVRRPTGDSELWAPIERVIPVVGCMGQAGASTVALALATVSGSARVVECSTASASGLSGAATAEMGSTSSGWRVGRRVQVQIARTGGVHLGVDEVPLPDEAPANVTVSVLDVGWELGHVMASSSWVREQVLDNPAVLVTTPTVPGLRRLETALTLLDPHDDSMPVVALVGAGRRWPRQLRAVLGPRTRVLAAGDRIVPVPPDRVLRFHGLTGTPLPAPVLAAGRDILARLAAGDTENTTSKGHS